MTSLIDVDLERQWTWRCASSYTADARVAQKPNVKLAQKLNVANTRAIAEAMQLPADSLAGLHIATTVHDIGKLAIPAEILSKPARLSAIERQFVQTHPQIAFDILQTIDFPWPVAEIILQHHERLDGSGYPRGLRDDEIRLEARILAVADVVEAMSSHRPYRPALGVDMALEEISANKGKLYDPVVVDVCVNLFLQNEFQFD